MSEISAANDMMVPSPLPMGDGYRILLIGTSEVVAGKIRSILDNCGNVHEVVQVDDGVAGTSHMRRNMADVIVMDIGDPEVEALTTIRRLKRIDPIAQIVMVSTLSFANVKLGAEGLVQGAVEFLQTPAVYAKEAEPASFRAKLKKVLSTLAETHRQRAPCAARPKPAAPHAPPAPEVKRTAAVPVKNFSLRSASRQRPSVIAVASSTGGPQALLTVFDQLPVRLNQPIFVTQHMPEGFTSALANHISKRTPWACVEATDGMKAGPKQIFIAPGDYHMLVKGSPAQPTIKLNKGEPENYCRPSAEPMVRSLIEMYGAANILMVVLTGMGRDGANAAKAVADGGGTVIAQDQETSVVWGMPGAVAQKGYCSAVLPLNDIPKKIVDLAK